MPSVTRANAKGGSTARVMRSLSVLAGIKPGSGGPVFVSDADVYDADVYDADVYTVFLRPAERWISLGACGRCF